MVLPRLYAILDVDACAARRLSPRDVFDAWLAAGVRLMQLRAKQLASDRLLELADAFAEESTAAGAQLIVDDRADIARLARAAGVHVGQTDLSPRDARLVVGDSAVVGISTHSDEQVRLALGEPVDYIAIGPVFATRSKARPDPVVGLDGVRRARAITAPSEHPLVAIGGITLAHARSVIEAGADSVAVISDLLAGDLRARAREFLRAVNEA